MRRKAEAMRLVISPRLVAICLAGSFMLVVGAVLSIPYLFLMAGSILSMPIVGYLMACRLLARIAVERSAPEMVEEGEEFEVELIVRNQGLLPRFMLKLADRLPEDLERLGPEPVLPAIGAHEQRRICYRVRARRRSACRLGTVDASCDDLLGIFHVHMSLGQPAEILVYPKPLGIDALRLVPWLYGRDGSSHLVRPQGSEIHGVREYHEGDELRRIHWPTSARSGRLVVMEFEDSPRQNVLIAIDHFALDKIELLDCAARIARTITDAVLQSGGAVRLLAGGNCVAAESPQQAPMLYAALARMLPDPDQDLMTGIEKSISEADVPILMITHLEDQLGTRIAALAERGWRVFPVLAAVSNESSDRFLNPLPSVEWFPSSIIMDQSALNEGTAFVVAVVRCGECKVCDGV